MLSEVQVAYIVGGLRSVWLLGSLLLKIWQDRAISSLLGSFPRVGGAIPPPATKINIESELD